MPPSQSRRARSESRAQDFAGRRRGFYVVNENTDLVVAGPYDTELDAQREAERRNAIPPATSDLVARLIVPDHPGRGSYRHG